MFEQVGQHRSSRRRLWGPLLLTITLNGAGLATLIVNSGQQLVSHFQNPMPPAPVFVSFPKPAPPGPPGPPAAAPKAKPEPKPEPTPEPAVEPDPEPQVEPAEPAEPAEPIDAAPSAGGGIDGGSGEPGGGGGGECPPGQDCDGESTAPCPPGMVCDGDQIFVSSADVRVKRRVAPRYPDAAKALSLSETRCIVTFSVDPKGRPAQVQIDGCPAVFHPALEEAAWKWRFYPVRDAQGRPQAATFRLSTVFRLR